MSKIYLIRHGQASYGTSNYDQLSDLGVKQARWLGEYFLSKQMKPDTIMGGTLQRHEQTVMYHAAYVYRHQLFFFICNQ